MAYPTDPIYKFEKDIFSGENCSVSKMEGNIKINIPLNEDNTDYQEFLKWKADGGVPEEAD